MFKLIFQNYLFNKLKNMLNESQRNYLKSIIKESIFEIANEGNEPSQNNNHSNDSSDKMAKRDSVMSWLDTAQELHSVLSYELWGKKNASETEKASARSLFSKKFRGEDADGKEYHFDDNEINSLYNMKNRYINKIK